MGLIWRPHSNSEICIALASRLYNGILNEWLDHLPRSLVTCVATNMQQVAMVAPCVCYIYLARVHSDHAAAGFSHT